MRQKDYEAPDFCGDVSIYMGKCPNRDIARRI